MTDIAPLTREEVIAFDDCEQRIERGLKTFIEVGTALIVIRDSKLYRGEFLNFEVYLEKRWNLKRQRAYELMSAAAVVSEFSDSELPPPAKEAHAAALAKVPGEDRADVWAETLERTNGKPTAAAVAEVSEEQRKRAELQRDAREHLRRIVDLAWSPNWPAGHVEAWIKDLGPYDDELSDLCSRGRKAIQLLDELIEGAGQ
jgi:hypothetical protein